MLVFGLNELLGELSVRGDILLLHLGNRVGERLNPSVVGSLDPVQVDLVLRLKRLELVLVLFFELVLRSLHGSVVLTLSILKCLHLLVKVIGGRR